MLLHITVRSAKTAETVAFYQWLLGLPVVETVKSPTGEIVFLGGGETKFEIIPDEKAQAVAAENLTIGFAVDSLDEKIALLKSREIPCTPVLSPAPGVKFVVFTDLNGCRIQLCEQGSAQ
ncbi:MAG: VOC family protein [Oscillospiraceae bacterium]